MSDEIKTEYQDPVNVEKQLRFEDVFGHFRTITAVPTDTPINGQSQIRVYKSGSDIRLYFYDTANNAWNYIPFISVPATLTDPNADRIVFWDDSDGKITYLTVGSGLSISGTTITASKKFGGTGEDGALSISSGTTTIDLGGASIFIKNYTSISITGTGKLAFSNPHANGTWVILKCQDDCTLTSSTTPMIDLVGIGAAGGAGGGVGAAGSAGTTATLFDTTVARGGGGGGGGGAAGSAGAGYGVTTFYTKEQGKIYRKSIVLVPGSGGGGGGGGNTTHSGGAGGRGGGALYLEVGGIFTFTTALGISVAGQAGTVGGGGGVGTGNGGGGGGGGSQGMCLVLYNTAGTISGSINTAGGAGGAGGEGDGTGASAGAGGGGAGSYSGAGGIGSTTATRTPGNGATGAGGGGGCGRDGNAASGVGLNAGSAGSSDGGLVAVNTEFA